MTVITRDATEKMEECVRGSLSGTMTFPDVLGALKRLGVERYHADYSRQEITYYLADGQSHVVSVPHPEYETAQAFSAENVAVAVGESQGGEHGYLDVQLAGGRVHYLGRKGEIHTETFPV